MYIKLSYDGRITSTSATPSRRISGDLSLSSYNELVIEVNGGDISYYDDDYDSYCSGKVKYIGNIFISYYDDDYDSYCRGKVKYVGNTFISYYDDDYDSYKVGKVKYVGDTFISA